MHEDDKIRRHPTEVELLRKEVGEIRAELKFVHEMANKCRYEMQEVKRRSEEKPIYFGEKR